MWVAGYGPKALALTGEVGDGFILQLADPDDRRVDDQGRARRRPSGAGRDPDDVTICVAAPAYVGDDLAHMRDQCRWFGGMVGNHVADIVDRYGDVVRRARRRSPTTSRAARATTTTSTARPATRTPTFVPDEIVDRFCILGPVDEHARAARTSCRTLGVDQFAIYLQHDGKDAHARRPYGEHVIPALAEHALAKS